MSKRYPGGIIRKTPQTPSQTSAQGIWDMASVTQAVKENTWPIAGVPDPISRSLRFRSSASAYLTRTLTTPTNSQKWTFSDWIKRGSLASNQFILQAGNSVNDEAQWYFTTSDTIRFYQYTGSYQYDFTTAQVFRDPSAWYHIVVQYDSTQATAANRFRVYVNGSQITLTTSTNVSLNATDSKVNSAVSHDIGGSNIEARWFDGYLTEINFIDGQALTPSSFGTTDDQTGVWEPIAYTGTYGTNGFYLPFSNTASTATLGNDFSGNSNNWTTNNISLTSGTTYDSMVDVPTQWIPYNTAGDTGALWRGNYCVFNPLVGTHANTYSNGNLQVATSLSNAAFSTQFCTFGVSSGKWYWEITCQATVDAFYVIGIAASTVNPDSQYVGQGNSYAYRNDTGQKANGTWTSYGATFTTGDIIGVAFDADAGTLVFYKNGVSQGTAFSSISGTYFPAVSDLNNDTSRNSTFVANFGQRPFAYAPPSGFLTLNTRNLPTPTIGTTSTTQAGDYFDVVTYTGAGGTQTISGLQFQPDFIWGKARSAAYGSALFDSVRGYGSTKGLVSNLTQAEGTVSAQYGYISTNTSTGFTAAAGNDSSNPNAALNESGVTYVAWNWKANGSGSSNTAGTITSTVSANTTAGFSVVTYTGNGTSSQTCGHGLGVTPSMVIWKNRNDVDAWIVYHSALTTSEYLVLNTTAAKATVSGLFTGISSTVLPLNNASAAINANGFNYVAYCFAQVAGYSAFGSYTGNGSSDGPFIFTGFRPRFVMIKRTDSTGNWIMFDSARGTYNVNGPYLYANSSSVEGTSTSIGLDFLSNGFKNRNTYNDSNTSSATYIYMAVAENPFKFSLAR